MPEEPFLIEYEAGRYEKGEIYIESNGYRFAIKAPSLRKNDIEIENIRVIMNDITESIDEKDWNKIQNIIDVESFVKIYVLNEYLKTVDFGYSSVFFYYKQGKLYAGPVWDFDLSAGNVWEAYSTEYALSYKMDGLYAFDKQLFGSLCECREFQREVIKCYREYQEYIRNLYADNGLIDSCVEISGMVFDRNFSLANWEVGRKYSGLMKQPYLTFQENITYLKNWLRGRNNWLCDYWDIYSKLCFLRLDWNDGIAVRFYMWLDESIVKDGSSYMLFSFQNGEESLVKVSDALEKEIYGKKVYIFTCNIADREITEKIKARMVFGGRKGKEYTCSVNQFLLVYGYDVVNSLKVIQNFFGILTKIHAN